MNNAASISPGSAHEDKHGNGDETKRGNAVEKSFTKVSQFAEPAIHDQRSN
jgi:hypothetical protein